MNLDLCFYFEVHQPWRLRCYRYREVGRAHDYFDTTTNARILRRVADKCYLPMNALLEELIHRYWPRFRVSFSISSTALMQMQAYAPDVLASFRRLVATGGVELLTETSHHSLAALYDEHEFAAQVALQRERVLRLLGEPGPVFRNTELIMSDAIARQVARLGYRGVLIEGADALFADRNVCRPQRLAAAPTLKALARHYRLSDDIAFRFSNRGWREWPLTAERYVSWLRSQRHALNGDGCIDLFMDYETFGEHQWADTGIFNFMRALPGAVLAEPGLGFATPGELLARLPVADPPLPMPKPVSWADLERDTSAWTGNRIQRDAQRAAYALGPAVARAAADDPALMEDWRRLLTSDHGYYMSTKYWSDGDVHKYFSPYQSPYDAYINYMNVLADLATRAGIRPDQMAQAAAA